MVGNSLLYMLVQFSSPKIQSNRIDFISNRFHNPITYNMVQQSIVKLLNGIISYSNNLLRRLLELKQEYANFLLPLYQCSVLNLVVKTLNYNSSGVYTKISSKSFLTIIQNFLIIFFNVLLQTSYKSRIFCSPLPLPNLCNDIAILSCTSMETLKRVFCSSNIGPTSHTKI